MSEIARFPWGYIGTYDDNEIEIVSTISDPPKVRLAVQHGQVESNLGATSFNIRRSDGRHEEMAYMMGRITEGGEAAAIYLATRDVGDEQPRERFFLDSKGAHFRVPVFAPNLGEGGGGRVSEMWSQDGRYVTVQQGDGNFVTYDTKRSPQWVPVWSAWSGKIK